MNSHSYWVDSHLEKYVRTYNADVQHVQLVPSPGMQCFVADSGTLYLYHGNLTGACDEIIAKVADRRDLYPLHSGAEMKLSEYEDLQDLFRRVVSDAYGMYTWPDPKPKACECGSEKARTAGHSTWCPKYEA